MEIAVGPLVLDLPARPLLEDARVIVDIAVGLVLFELGRRLDLQWLRRDQVTGQHQHRGDEQRDLNRAA